MAAGTTPICLSHLRKDILALPSNVGENGASISVPQYRLSIPEGTGGSPQLRRPKFRQAARVPIDTPRPPSDTMARRCTRISQTLPGRNCASIP